MLVSPVPRPPHGLTGRFRVAETARCRHRSRFRGCQVAPAQRPAPSRRLAQTGAVPLRRRNAMCTERRICMRAMRNSGTEGCVVVDMAARSWRLATLGAAAVTAAAVAFAPLVSTSSCSTTSAGASSCTSSHGADQPLSRTADGVPSEQEIGASRATRSLSHHVGPSMIQQWLSRPRSSTCTGRRPLGS